MNKNSYLSSMFSFWIFKSWVLILLFIAIPSQTAFAQDPDEDDDVEVFFDDEEGYDDDEYYEDDEEYLDDEYEDYDEDDYEDDEEEYDEEDEEGDEESDTDLSDEADRLGYTIDIAGSSPRFVNEHLQEYSSSVDARMSVEFPLLMRVLGTKFRFGVEVGTFKFEHALPPALGKAKGITAMGILAFPAGPGKIKVGSGVIGKSFGFMAEVTYGLNIGGILDIRLGLRTTEALNLQDSESNMLGHVGWMDGVVMMGINL